MKRETPNIARHSAKKHGLNSDSSKEVAESFFTPKMKTPYGKGSDRKANFPKTVDGKTKATPRKNVEREERENVEIDLPTYVGDLLVFPRGGLKYAGKASHGNETQHKKDLDGFYDFRVDLPAYTESLNLNLSGLGGILRDGSQTLENPFISAKLKIENRRETSALKRSSTVPVITEVNGWGFLHRVSKNRGEKTSKSLFKLAKLIESSKDEDVTKIIKDAVPKDVIPFLLSGFFKRNEDLVSSVKLQDNSTATAFYKQALKAELFLLAWQMRTLEGENKSLDGRRNVDLLDVGGSGAADMIAAIDNKRYTAQKVYDRNLDFPKAAANFQYGAMIQKEGKLNIAERNPSTRPSTLRYAGDKGPLSEEQSMDWQPIERRIEEGGGLVDLVRKHGSGKSEFAGRIEHKLSHPDPDGLKLGELLRGILEFNEAGVKDDFASPMALQYSPPHTNSPNPTSPAVEKRRVSGVGIDKIQNDTRLFKINLHSSSEEIETITSFINLQDDILQHGPKFMLHRLRGVDGIDDILGRDDKEKLKNLKLISKTKLVVLADEFYYFNDKQIRQADDKTVREIEEIKYDLIDKWCKSGSVVVTLGASASLGKIGVECEELGNKIKKEQENLSSEGNKAVVKKARSFLYSFNGKNLKDDPVFFKVLDDRKSVDQAEEKKKSANNRREKSGISWKGRAEVELSDTKTKMPIKVNKSDVTNREYLIRSAWCIKELGKFAPPKIKNCKEYADIISALTPKIFEAKNFPDNPKYLWGELNNVDEIIAGKKAKNSRQFSLNEEDLFKAVKLFIVKGLCDSFPSGKNDGNSSGYAKTTISELKEELGLKQSQYDDLKSRLDDAVKRFGDFSFALESPKDPSVTLFEVVESNLPRLDVGEKMQYILPQFKINAETCTDGDIKNILERSGANIVIIPHKEAGSNEPKCKIAYLVDGAVNIEISKSSEINDKLESISERVFLEQKVSMLSFYDKDNAIGGDYGIASVGIRYQTVQATDKNFLVGSKSKPAVTFQEIEQNERRNRVDLEDINDGDVISKFVMPSDAEGIEIGKCGGDKIPQELMDVIARNTRDHDNMISEVYRQYIGNSSVVDIEVVEPENIDSDVVESFDGGDEYIFVPTHLSLDESGLPFANSVELEIVGDTDPDIEEEEEFEIDSRYYNITVRSREVNEGTDIEFSDVEQDDKYSSSSENYFNDEDSEEINDLEDDVSYSSKLDYSSRDSDKDFKEMFKTPSPRSRAMVLSMSSLSDKKMSSLSDKKMFESIKFDLREDNPLFELREKCQTDCLIYCYGVYGDSWENIAKTIGKIIIEAAQEFALDCYQIVEALDLCQICGGIGDNAHIWLSDGDDKLPDNYKDNEQKYIRFTAKVQDLCKECGIFSIAINEEEQELYGLSAESMPKALLYEIETNIVKTGGDFKKLEKIYDCDLVDKAKSVKREIYGERKRAQNFESYL